MATPVKLYPVKARYLNTVPAAVQVVPTKADAEDLIASGAFTDNPNHPDRDKDAPDHTDEGPVVLESTTQAGEEPDTEA